MTQSKMLIGSSATFNYCIQICFVCLVCRQAFPIEIVVASPYSDLSYLVAMATLTNIATKTSCYGQLLTTPTSGIIGDQQQLDATDPLKDAQLDRSIGKELNASAAVARELRRLQPAERTIGRALQLCLAQEPDMFCAWFAVSTRQAGLGVDGIYQLTCFNELQHTCNRVSSKNRGRHTQCRPGCAPCRRIPSGSSTSDQRIGGGSGSLGSLGIVSDSPTCIGCSQRCYCTCDYVLGSNSTYLVTNYYPCHQLCSGESQCPTEADESPANCDDYAATAPNFLFYVIVLGCIGGVAALCSLPFVLPKVRKYCCRGPSDEDEVAGAVTAATTRVGRASPAANQQHQRGRKPNLASSPPSNRQVGSNAATAETAAFLPAGDQANDVNHCRTDNNGDGAVEAAVNA